MLYAASFDLRDGRHGFGSVTFRCASAEFTVALTSLVTTLANGQASSVYNHVGTNQFAGEDGVILSEASYGFCTFSFADVFVEAMQTAAGATAWPDPSRLQVVGNGDPYRFTYSDRLFTAIEFSNSAAMRLFGFTANFSGSAESVTGTGTPNFIISPILSAVTTEETNGYIYEPSKISAAATSAAGMQYGLARTQPPLFRNWMQQSETRAKTLRGQAIATHPCTHQLLVESCRSVYPFVVVDGFGDGFDYLFRLRPEGAMWTTNVCARAGGDMDDALFDIQYHAQQIASVTYSA